MVAFCVRECGRRGCKCKTLAYNSDTKECFLYSKAIYDMSYEIAEGFEMLRLL